MGFLGGGTILLSTVHVGRSLQAMRANGLINLRCRRLIIPDVERLRAARQFNSNYLNMNRYEPGRR